MKLVSVTGLLRILRNRWLARLLGHRAEWLLVCRLRENYEAYVPLLIGELITSRSVRYSNLILQRIQGLPTEVRESNELLRRHFITDALRASSVEEGATLCQNALIRCFRARCK